jgi:hypothetical protein
MPPWVVVALVMLWTVRAEAYSLGYTGRSGKQGSTCNTIACHRGGQDPHVRFEGPTQLAPGTTATFRFVVESVAAAQTAAGFNVAASDGRLAVIPGQGAQLLTDELTQTVPKDNIAGVASWEFKWTAPSAPGMYVLYGAGNSVDLDETRRGDRAATGTIAIAVGPSRTPTRTPTSTSTVTRTPTRTASLTPTPPPTPTVTPTPGPQRGDANCDARLSAADPSATVRLLGTDGVGDCFLADADCDARITDGDLQAAIDGIFGDVRPDCEAEPVR